MNYFSFRHALFVLCFLGLVGCSVLKKPETESEKVVDDESTESVSAASEAPGDPLAVEPAFVAIPKPARESTPDIPRAARTEFHDALAVMANNRWQDAEARWLLMTETYPLLASVYTNLGIVYQKLNKVEEAEKAYRFAIETNTYSFDAYTNLGVMLRELGRFEEAEQTYVQALSLWPHHPESLKNLGILYDLYLGKLDQALTNYELLQKLNETEDKRLRGWIVDLKRRIEEQRP